MSQRYTKQTTNRGKGLFRRFGAQPSLMLKFRKPLIVSLHSLAFAVSLMCAFLVANRMEFHRAWFVDKYLVLLLPTLLIKLIVFGFFKQYRGWWRYVGISDLLGIFRASFMSTLALLVLWLADLNIAALRRSLPEAIADVSQGVYIADLFGTIMFLSGLRMLVRLYHEEFRAADGVRLKRFLIVGAGNAGESLLREIHRMAGAEYDVIGFIDDDPAKQGISIHGMAVLGTVTDLPRICEEKNIDEIAIAIPSATHQQRRRMIQVCEGTQIRFQTVPSLTDIAFGKLKVSQIRDVDINDLLGRAAVVLDIESIEAYLSNKVVLVTGAGGSIGSEMCRQICKFDPRQLILLEQAENPLFYIERELHKTYAEIPLETVICNITDKRRVDTVFQKYQPDVVIHAAAHKHVPLMELNPSEAIKNNVCGTRIVADAAHENGVLSFVMISTDKAVNPTSIMGSAKRIAEMYIQTLDRSSATEFVTVRFGNVLGSEGSVVPIFKQQIADGGPVTVTDPEMQRYFMTIPEASQLVLQAATMGRGGEILLLDMGEPVKIVDLAKELIILSGFRPGDDIEIVFTGLRPGEKLFEELSIEGEDMQATFHPKISIWKNRPVDQALLRQHISHLIEVAVAQDRDEIMTEIKHLVPEYMGVVHAG